MVYSAKHREYQLVSKSTVPCFFKLVLFSQCRFFPLWYAPAVPPELGGTTQIWGTLKTFRRCPQLQNRVGANVLANT